MPHGHGIAYLPAYKPDASLPAFKPGLAALRQRIGAIEHANGLKDAADGPVSIAPPVDAALPWGGLPRGCLHEIVGGEAAYGFAAALAARLAGDAGGVLWCLRPRATFDAGDLHGPGLVRFGLKPGRLILAHARNQADLLWAMEEGLRSGAPAAVLGEVTGIGLTASRRLQLAAEASGVTALLLHRPDTKRGPDTGQAKFSAAVTHWRVTPVSSNPAGISLPPHCMGEGGEGGENAFAGAARADRKTKHPHPALPHRGGGGPAWGSWDSNGPGITARWRVDLLRCRFASPKSWLMDWRAGQIRIVDKEACDANRDSTANDQESTKTAQTADAGGFAVVAELFDRPAEPAARLRTAS